MLLKHGFRDFNINLVITQAAHFHSRDSLQSTDFITNPFAQFAQIILTHFSIDDEGDHFVQVLLDPHNRRLNAIRQAVKAIDPTLNVLQ